MKYVALLRAINVGGNNLIKMVELKEVFEQLGFTSVLTYINSGNVIFETSAQNDEKLIRMIETTLAKKFEYEARIVVRSESEIRDVIKHAPVEWKERQDLRCYIGFLVQADKAKHVVSDIEVREGVDSVNAGPGVIYMTTRLEEKSHSKFNKLVGTPLYKEMTIRNFTTTSKILALMDKQ